MALDAFAGRVIRDFPLGFVATVTAEGRPAVSPKGTFLVLDDATLAFANIRSPGTLANLAASPAVEVNFVDPFLRKGVRIAGTAEILRRADPGFTGLLPLWQEAWPALSGRITALVRIRVESAGMLITPPYDDGATEEEMVALYVDKYRRIYP